ncbi:hypothetical protein QPM17_00205 [Marinobacter sp. TBZ242]|uniref:Secreted protein n=1 Tax=Marinobacter azerbaijanicus TaxID=3050455 RepID=A0ABT7I6A4_9GAMM|nr:hypothetical protein [Marinobacter sp. TBZ242]MDL0429533.1 hypothetical protein [Marinobacter sp. TBZ242]
MLRALVAVLAIVGVVALGVFGPRWLMSDADGQADQGVLSCDLLNDTCQWTQQGTLWEAHMEKEADNADGTVYQLSVETDENLPRLLAVLRGESMYMGEYPVPMTRTGPAEDGGSKLWEARFTAPVCTTNPEMTWRVDLQSGMEKPIDMPIKLTFQAEGRA